MPQHFLLGLGVRLGAGESEAGEQRPDVSSRRLDHFTGRDTPARTQVHHDRLEQLAPCVSISLPEARVTACRRIDLGLAVRTEDDVAVV